MSKLPKGLQLHTSENDRLNVSFEYSTLSPAKCTSLYEENKNELNNIPQGYHTLMGYVDKILTI